MRVAIGQLRELDEGILRFAQQLGVEGVQVNTPKLPGEKRWEFMDLLRLRMHAADYGLRLEAIENVPISFYDKAMLGLPGRDEQIENYQETIRNIGRAGIPILGYHWIPNSVWRTSRTTPGRGGASVTSFDMELAKNAPLTHGRVFTAEEMWANYEYFIRAVVPVAEEAGVKLALHPDDPPVESLGGIARIFRDFEGFRRAMELVPSPNSGLDFCMGCWSEMGPGVIDAIEYFASRGKIFYIHFRDVQGMVPRFQECFLGEGNVDVVEAIRTLKRVGFTGFLIDDHVPRMVDDTPWGHRGRAYATGYIMGLVNAVKKLG
ncbi:MAG: mannonate dehydratase [Chloroflexi bacterium]|nr:mannonate dehydratase [Chloroflexota bacterium]